MNNFASFLPRNTLLKAFACFEPRATSWWPVWISFLHRIPKLGIPVEMVPLLMKLLLKQRILALYHDFQ